MKLEEPVNSNYAAVVVQVNHINELDNCDNVVGVPVFGYQAIVSKDVQVGDLMLFFPAESQLSVQYAYENNLHRHGDRNKDEAKQGYLEDSRRIKALKFRGHQSDALLMPIDSLNYIKGIDLKVGDTFDKINGNDIVQKYFVKPKGEARINKNAVPKVRRVDAKFMPEHYDTDQYFRNRDHVPENADIVVTQKLHGTSIRIGNTIAKRKLGWKDRLAKRFGVRVADTEFAHVYGSRKVIKDINDPDQDHFYGHDLWTEIGSSIDDLVPDNFILYGEVIGFLKDGRPIQKNYTYDLGEGQHRLYIYRIAVITNQGRVIDLSWDGVKHFCEEAGLNYVPELWRGKHKDFIAEEWIDKRYVDEGYAQAVQLSTHKKGIVDEGVCVRTDAGVAPYILKAKSPLFLQHETKMLDEEAEDVEAEESVE